MVHAPGIGWCALGIRRASLVGEDGDQTPVPGVEVQVALRRVVEVGLLEDERHPEHALPEVDRRLSAGAHQGDVVHALALDLLHAVTVLFCWRSSPGGSYRSR